MVAKERMLFEGMDLQGLNAVQGKRYIKML